MKLNRLRVDGFGALAGEWRFESGRIQLVVGDNERGKTTFATAIAAALYGLESDKRSWREKTTPHELYKPWSGGPYALELEFEIKDSRWIVTRNFASGKLAVLENGREATEDFRVGPGEYKVGEMLLGMSAEQFSRSALWLQAGPGRWGGEDVRPDGSLSSLLEDMSATKQGDGTATRALGALDEALKNYRGLQNSGRIENEIKKLDNAIGGVEINLKAAENERAALAQTLARLAEVEDAEGALTKQLGTARRADASRRRADLISRLATDASDRAQLAAARDEIARLAPARTFPADAAGRLRHAHAEANAAQNTLDAVAQEREKELTAPRAEADRALRNLDSFAWAESGSVQDLFDVERDLEKSRLEHVKTLDKRAELEKELAARGISISQLSELAARFGGLLGEDRSLLTQYPAQTQSIVVESENAQRAIKGGQVVLDEVRKARDRQRVIGIVLAVLGLVAGAGSVYLAFLGRVMESFVGLGVTLFALTGATILLLRCASYRNAERTEALKQVLDAQRKVGELQTRRKEREDQLGVVAERVGFADVTGLLREHGEYLRLTNESQRTSWLDEDARRADDLRRAASARLAEIARRAGLAESDPPHELTARLRQGIGGVLEARARIEQLAAVERRIDDQETAARARLSSARRETMELAEGLGIASDGDDAALTEAIDRRQRDRARLMTLETELVPSLEARLLSAEARATLEAECVRLEAEAGNAGAADAVETPAPRRSATELETELSSLRRERLELTGRIGGRDRESAESVARLIAQRVELSEAKERASSFKEAVEIARDRFQSVARETHLRWSENLSSRVDELLARFGMTHAGFQVSDKLEISLSLGGERLTGPRLDQALSAGARDQVALALRVAICEYLARGGERLPIVLDDPFASADDGRSGRLLGALAEIVKTGHPVVALTCHRTKVEALRGHEPAWFDGVVQTLPLAEAPSGARLEPLDRS